ncbi:MAG: hypothetical protein ACT443_08855 [Gemmatimonadota bacterium]
MIDRSSDSKLDRDLVDLIEMNFIHAKELVPVVLRSANSDLECIGSAVRERGGEVRHVLGRYNALAAWLPLDQLQSIAVLSCVGSVELDQPARLA